MNNSIRVFAPATVANVCCGFDILGFAINEPGDIVELKFCDKPGIHISKISGDNGRLPLNPNKNTAGVALYHFLKHLNYDGGFEMILEKRMPLKSGLGSSAASAVASVVAANILLDSPLEKKDLIPFLLEAEKFACGTSHADNVAPSLLGGFTLIRSYNPLDVIKINYPKNLYVSIIHPDLTIDTKTSRSILNKKIDFTDAVTQWGNIAGLVSGLEKENLEIISRSFVDVIVEPIRSRQIPNFYSIKNTALNAGSLGCSISGSGPSIFALSDGKEKAISIGNMMKNECEKSGISSTIYISKINAEGAKILD